MEKIHYFIIIGILITSIVMTPVLFILYNNYVTSNINKSIDKLNRKNNEIQDVYYNKIIHRMNEESQDNPNFIKKSYVENELNLLTNELEHLKRNINNQENINMRCNVIIELLLTKFNFLKNDLKYANVTDYFEIYNKTYKSFKKQLNYNRYKNCFNDSDLSDFFQNTDKINNLIIEKFTQMVDKNEHYANKTPAYLTIIDKIINLNTDMVNMFKKLNTDNTKIEKMVEDIKQSDEFDNINKIVEIIKTLDPSIKNSTHEIKNSENFKKISYILNEIQEMKNSRKIDNLIYNISQLLKSYNIPNNFHNLQYNSYIAINDINKILHDIQNLKDFTIKNAMDELYLKIDNLNNTSNQVLEIVNLIKDSKKIDDFSLNITNLLESIKNSNELEEVNASIHYYIDQVSFNITKYLENYKEKLNTIKDLKFDELNNSLSDYFNKSSIDISNLEYNLNNSIQEYIKVLYNNISEDIENINHLKSIIQVNNSIHDKINEISNDIIQILMEIKNSDNLEKSKNEILNKLTLGLDNITDEFNQIELLANKRIEKTTSELNIINKNIKTFLIEFQNSSNFKEINDNIKNLHKLVSDLKNSSELESVNNNIHNIHKYLDEIEQSKDFESINKSIHIIHDFLENLEHSDTLKNVNKSIINAINNLKNKEIIDRKDIKSINDSINNVNKLIVDIKKSVEFNNINTILQVLDEVKKKFNIDILKNYNNLQEINKTINKIPTKLENIIENIKKVINSNNKNIIQEIKNILEKNKDIDTIKNSIINHDKNMAEKFKVVTNIKDLINNHDKNILEKLKDVTNTKNLINNLDKNMAEKFKNVNNIKDLINNHDKNMVEKLNNHDKNMAEKFKNVNNIKDLINNHDKNMVEKFKNVNNIKDLINNHDKNMAEKFKNVNNIKDLINNHDKNLVEKLNNHDKNMAEKFKNVNNIKDLINNHDKNMVDNFKNIDNNLKNHLSYHDKNISNIKNLINEHDLLVKDTIRKNIGKIENSITDHDKNIIEKIKDISDIKKTLYDIKNYNNINPNEIKNISKNILDELFNKETDDDLFHEIQNIRQILLDLKDNKLLHINGAIYQQSREIEKLTNKITTSPENIKVNLDDIKIKNSKIIDTLGELELLTNELVTIINRMLNSEVFDYKKLTNYNSIIASNIKRMDETIFENARNMTIMYNNLRYFIVEHGENIKQDINLLLQKILH